MYVHVHAYRMNSTESVLFRQLLCVCVSLSPVTPVNGHHEWSEVGVLVSRSVHFGSLVQESATDLGMAVPGSQQQRIELHHQRKRERGGERERKVSRKSFFMYV